MQMTCSSWVKNKDELSKLKKILNQTFDMKDLGNAKNILGMRITWDMSEPRVKDRELEEGYKRTQEERNEVLREEWVY